MMGAALSWIIGTKLGRSLALAGLAIAAFLAWDYYDDKKAVSEALRAAEAQRKEINDAVAQNAIDARIAANRCRQLDGMRWNFASSRCERGSSGDR